MKRLLGVTLAGVLTFGLAACDDGGDDCDDVFGACDAAGTYQCGDDGVETCGENADGCLVWTTSEPCGDNQICTGDGDTAACVCDDGCPAEGDSECDGDAVRECQVDDDGCLGWVETVDCGDSGQTCDTSSGDAECVGGCESDCTVEDATQCTATDTVETCTDVDGGGCLQWTTTDDCAADGDVCDDSGDDAECVAPCVSDCDTAGDTQCNETTDDIEVCMDQGDGCLQWQLDTDCDDTDEVCDDSADPIVCAPACEPTCDTLDAVQCNATTDDVETCTDVDGCLQWTVTDDCDDTTEFCDSAATPPVCAVVCVSDCSTVDDTQCGTTSLGVETCTDMGAGCLQWVLTDDCAAETRSCDASGSPAVCGPPSTGDSCAAPMVMSGDTLTLDGSDFGADFTDTLAFSDASCTTRTDSSEAIFQVDLAVGEGILVRELGSLDAVLSLQTTCGDAGTCEFAEDGYETTGHRYQAEAAATTVFVVVEAWSSTTTSSYEIQLDIWTDEVCDDTLDNDLDGLVDCDDDDCFGLTGCTTETNCGDGEDNDDDGDTDCDDSDCTSEVACATYVGVYEQFDTGTHPFDLEGQVVTFTPDGTDPRLYTWATAAGTGAFAVTPGSSTAPTVATLTDDDDEAYTFVNMPSFTFYGVDYTSFVVGSNGYITFGASPDRVIDTEGEFFAQATIAVMAEDLNPSTLGTVTIDDFADHIVVTWAGVPFYGETDVNDVQAILRSDGSIELGWVAVPPAGFDSETIVVGITDGMGLLPYPDQQDFHNIAEDCGNSTDDDFDTLVDCDDPECFGDATSCTTELNCTDGGDNDDDGATDCADSDCSGDATCAPPAALVINEIAYDGPSSDDSEFIELYGTPDAYLGGYTIVHWNGGPATAAVVWEMDLTGVYMPASGFLVIGSTMIADADYNFADFSISDGDAIQNGAGDAIVLYTAWDSTAETGTVADAVAYEGTGNLPAATIETTPSEGVGHGDWATSIGRFADGTDTDDNSADLLPMWWPTPGWANPGTHAYAIDRVVGSVAGAETLPMSIPDGSATGVTATIDLTGETWWPATIADINVGVQIDHTWIGDLYMTLTSPDGTEVVLHNESGGSADDIWTVYDLETAVATGTMDDFNGENGRGVWTLFVADGSSLDSGEIVDWFMLAE